MTMMTKLLPNRILKWNSSPVPYIAYVDDHAVGMADLPVFPPYHPSDSHITVHTGIRERK